MTEGEPGKCSILFGNKCAEEAQLAIQSVLKYETQCFKEKYLGLPVPEGSMKSRKFKPVKEKFIKRASD
jgi:hypothetical protein